MIDLPPKQFDHSYSGEVIETILTSLEIKKYCGNEEALSCILFFPNFIGDKCFVYLPKVGVGGVSFKTQYLLKRHEIGHCNGWPANHPL